MSSRGHGRKLALPSRPPAPPPPPPSAREPAPSTSSLPSHPLPPTQPLAPPQPQRDPQRAQRPVKKKQPGRGRHMLVKVFYSLSSPRFNPTSAASPAPPPTPIYSAPSPSFLSVLDPSLRPDPALAPPPAAPPAAPPQSQQQSESQPHHLSPTTCIARLHGPVWVQLVGPAPPPPSSEAAHGARDSRKRKASSDRGPEFGKLTLKTCLSAICISRPELVADPSLDYAVAALDPYESSLHPAASQSAPVTRLMEGKGMLSWNLAEKREGTTVVVGRVTGDERVFKKTKVATAGSGAEEEDDDDESDEDGSHETLEVWLQLVERPAFTQNQFMTSLRSFANPAPQIPTRSSSPPPVPSHPNSFSGDPVKPTHVAPTVNFPLSSLPPALASLQEPQILSLLTQLLASSSTGTEAAVSSSAVPPTLNLDSEQGRALLPAIHTLAKFYGLPVIPPLEGTTTTPTAEPPPAPTPQVNTAAAALHREDPFPPLGVQVENNLNPIDQAGGCSNCKRRKSQIWRKGKQGDGRVVTVCNACGNYFNKHGRHRRKEVVRQATQPSQSTITAPVVAVGAAAARPSGSSVGRPLQGRLTATCEADLFKKAQKQKKRHSVPGMVPPPSPSKTIGPVRSPVLGSLRHAPYGTAGASHRRTSPGRVSPRKPTFSFLAATSPLRRNGKGGGSGFTLVGGSGYESDNELGSGAMDYTTLFGLHQSPSPRKHRGGVGASHVPSYLLTASPGTALTRILNDTSVDLNSFEMAGDQHSPLMPLNLGPLTSTSMVSTSATTVAAEDDMSFFIRSSPTNEKENEAPPVSSHLPLDQDRAAASTSTDMLTATDDFDTLLSSLQRDFDQHSSAVTAPSSAPPSSPCVQPRTSSATPGQKGKAPASCGRPAPSILDSFVDELVPAFAITTSAGGGEDTPVSESEGWTPLSAMSDVDSTRRHDGGGGTGGNHSFDLAQLLSLPTTGRRALLPIPGHVTSDAREFDFGSLPPSSPPVLPSETFPTPSDFDSGMTPDEDRYGNSYGVSANQDAVAALLHSLGAGGLKNGSTGTGVSSLNSFNHLGSGKVELDRSTVAHLLQMIQAQGTPPLVVDSPFAPSPFELAGETEDALTKKEPLAERATAPTYSSVLDEQQHEKSDAELKNLYDSLFSAGGFGIDAL